MVVGAAAYVASVRGAQTCEKGLIKIFPIDMKEQIADALAKALAQNNFQRHFCYMCGK
jgi:hypothetical protein